MSPEMNIALLGKGKSASPVAQMLVGNPPRVFDRSNPPTLAALAGTDVVISFLPGEAFNSYIPVLLQARLPVVAGGTGTPLPPGLDGDLRRLGLGWVWGHNFSLGMVFVRRALAALSGLQTLWPDCRATIEETHHTGKRDAPSGTALKWREWAGLGDIPITSERSGEVVGKHRLVLAGGSERIELTHKALDRNIFAEGALWAASRLCQKPHPGHGLLRFEDLVGEAFR